MKRIRNVVVMVFLFTFAGFGLFQIVLFQQFAGEASLIYALQMFGMNTPHDDERLGRICVAVGRSRCARDMFTKLQNMHPNDLEDMSNLAIVLTKNGKVREALPYFQAYTAAGGAADSVVRWYARALTAAGTPEQAIPWYYRALSADIHNREVAAELLTALKATGRTDEALSLREQMTEMAHFSAVELGTMDIERDIASEKMLVAVAKPATPSATETAPVTPNEYYFPSLDGRVFLLPFHYRADRSEFIAADPDRKTSVMNEVDLARWGLAPHVNGAGHVLIKELKLGQLAIHNAEMQVCDECKTMLGADVLAKAAGRVDTRNKIALLILTDTE